MFINIDPKLYRVVDRSSMDDIKNAVAVDEDALQVKRKVRNFVNTPSGTQALTVLSPKGKKTVIECGCLIVILAAIVAGLIAMAII
jgi:hypothetical protein